MKILNLKSILFLALISLVTIACSTKDPIEETNDMLNGKWEAISFKGDDNIERITGDITRNSILFQKDSVNTGQMSINIETSLVTLTGWSGPYTLINDGNRLSFADQEEFNISFSEEDILNMSLIDLDQPFTIQAEKVE